MLHDRLSIDFLAQLIEKRGIEHLIICPGSRNAPIVEAFCGRKAISCISIVDERSAAFFALGMAQQLQKPVVIACTSGSAPLNFAPAIAEAFYQRVPLLVLTADRPVEYIDQGEGQTIRQNNVFSNYIRQSLQLPQSIKTQDDAWYANRLISGALNACIYPLAGPVHINLPLNEPLYGFLPAQGHVPKDHTIQKVEATLSADICKDLAETVAGYSRVMVLVGQMSPSNELQQVLSELAEKKQAVILTETTSNIYNGSFITAIDRCLAAMPASELDYIPQLLITIGGAVVSKRIKSFLRQAEINEHWHVDPFEVNMDTYKHLTNAIPMKPEGFLSQILKLLPEGTDLKFCSLWKDLWEKARSSHEQYISRCEWSDLKIFKTIIDAVPPEYDIQLGNSTPVRYSQLFDAVHKFRYDSNRGTSGIDGSISTAAGACFATGRPTLIISGDLGFFYDSNALWNKHLSPALRIIVINNQGGGIFRFIPGPDQTPYLEEFFETRHNTSARSIASAFGLDYICASDHQQLEIALESFLQPGKRAVILEINSPPEKSAQTLREYFSFISKDAEV
jgi:2-succinyl-5-enolpyruvyl-6-hydroxy-3-cyclohexene-1-carboxylate synthase